MEIRIEIGGEKHRNYASVISEMIQNAAQKKGTILALRKPEFILEKIIQGKSVIALDEEIVVGFCYFQNWENDAFIAHSGLIINENYLGRGLSKKIKKLIFDVSRQKFPKAKIFGLTTSLPVMKINSELGYRPVTFSELTDDEQFWKGCQSCVNYDILTRTERKNCLCTGMLMNPNE
ncbi:MAG: GNAT family N-acetyltransferase [Flavobacteriales bacterium]|nr:GNAT family N-acetyltransferase [Flavobacteriales bacterium]MBO72000.1 GNAT family N-acetyltransferase [Flavobacteriales bacterium]|tara:strand:+ start:1200 stop:1730 length:531 start_codon:yes stop_codon:yes gene_type:complete